MTKTKEHEWLRQLAAAVAIISTQWPLAAHVVCHAVGPPSLPLVSENDTRSLARSLARSLGKWPQFFPAFRLSAVPAPYYYDRKINDGRLLNFLELQDRREARRQSLSKVGSTRSYYILQRLSRKKRSDVISPSARLSQRVSSWKRKKSQGGKKLIAFCTRRPEPAASLPSSFFVRGPPSLPPFLQTAAIFSFPF